MAESILPADKKFKKQVLITLAIALPVCVCIFFYFKIYFIKTSNGSDVNELIGRVHFVILWISVINGVVSAWLATRFVFLSIKTFQYNQFPPPNIRVIWNTKIRTGKHAKVAGILMIVSAILVLSTNLLLFFLCQSVNNLIRQLTIY